MPSVRDMKGEAARRAEPLRGIIFDLDGTLVDSGLDFDAMRQEMGLAAGLPLLEAIARLEPQEAERCRAILHRHELEGALRATPQPGVIAFLRQLTALALRLAVVTRNNRQAAGVTLVRCHLRFEQVLTRDDGPIKPSPWAIQQICRRWAVSAREVLVIGDFHFDIEAARAAGATAVLVCNGKDPSTIPGHEIADFFVPSLAEAETLTRHIRSRAQAG